MKLVFATNNAHKLEEVQAILDPAIHLVTLSEAGVEGDIPEPHATLEENAREKSSIVYALVSRQPGIDGCFSEDTGLEVDALGGEPGVKSARYAGDERSFEKNMDKLLNRLAGKSNRSAQFRTIISLIINGKETQFEGICPGRIMEEKRGAAGFGYDPLFVPEGASKSFAEMDLAEKGRYSHRARAIEKLVAFLNQQGATK